jgi:hypothetical protein
MGEYDDDNIQHYAPVLRRIIILVAVITAVPVVLWTITAFVRTYVGPPKIPTFHQLAATASINAPAAAVSPDGTAQLQAAMQAKLANPPAATVEARATATDARDFPMGQKGSLAADRSPDSDAGVAAQDAPQTADTSITPASVTSTSVMARAGDVFPPSPLTTDTATPNNTGALAAAQPAAAMDPAEEALPVSAPLSGRIPLPRHRPHNVDAMRTADMTPPSNVPMPRPRPRPDGAGAPAETTGASPIEFIQNLFH